MSEPPLITVRLTVRFSDCDPLGHVNNAVYLTYLEQTRIVLWRRQIGSWSQRRPDGTRGEGFILARTEIDFRAQARDGETLDVRLWLASFGRSSAVYRYEIVDATSGRLVAEAKSVQVWFDYTANKSVPLTDETKARLSVVIPGIVS